MADEEESEELVMIAEKARTLLNRGERQVLSQCCNSYLSGQTNVRYFVDALLRLLPTPDKATFLVELRELVRDEDHGEYDHRAFTVRRPFRAVQFQSSNNLDYEQSTECLLQVDRHPHYPEYELLENNSTGCSPVVSRAHNKPLKPKSLVACEVVVGTIQPPRATTTQAFRGGLKESNMPMMEFDMTTAFPTLAASAFKPIATTASLIAKESLNAAGAGAGTTSTTTTTTTTHLPPEQRPAKPGSTSRWPVSGDEPTEVVIRKTKTILGMAIEGGADTRHPLPRIITIDAKGTAFEAAGLRIGQTILQVNGIKMDGAMVEINFPIYSIIINLVQKKQKLILTLHRPLTFSYDWRACVTRRDFVTTHGSSVSKMCNVKKQLLTRSYRIALNDNLIGLRVIGLTHEEAARLIANAYADRSVPEMKLLLSPSTFRPNANYQPEN